MHAPTHVGFVSSDRQFCRAGSAGHGPQWRPARRPCLSARSAPHTGGFGGAQLPGIYWREAQRRKGLRRFALAEEPCRDGAASPAKPEAQGRRGAGRGASSPRGGRGRGECPPGGAGGRSGGCATRRGRPGLAGRVCGPGGGPGPSSQQRGCAWRGRARRGWRGRRRREPGRRGPTAAFSSPGGPGSSAGPASPCARGSGRAPRRWSSCATARGACALAAACPSAPNPPTSPHNCPR